MTTPAGVPNLPLGALTVDTLAEQLQDMSQTAMKNRAGARMPEAFEIGSGGSMLSDLSPMGILTNLWAGFNSTVANADPADIQGPEDLPDLLIDFLETIPVVGILVRFMEALGGDQESVDFFLKPIFDFFQWLWGLFNGDADELLKPIFEFLKTVWDTFGDLISSVSEPILGFLNTLFSSLGSGFGGFLDFLASALTLFFDTFGDVLETVLTPLLNLGKWVMEQFGGIITSVVMPLISWVIGAWEDLGEAVQSILQTLVDFLKAIFQDGFQGIWDFITKLFGNILGLLPSTPAEAINMVTEWVKGIPLIGPLFYALTGKTEADGAFPSLSELAIWGQKLLTGESPINAANLFGEIPKALLSIVPVANINVDSANLVSQGDFGSSGTIDPGSGWSWDGSVSDPDSPVSNGSARVETNGTARYLYSRQAIPVAGGDKIKLSVRVKTASYAGSSSSIVLGVVPYSGTTAQSEVLFASRGATNTTWATMTGTAPNRDPYVVPDGITSLIIKIGVTSASGSGSTVWFDNVDLRKEGLLGQNLVEYLLAAWEGAWQAIFGGTGAGKVWSDFVTAISKIKFDTGNAAGAADTAQGLGVGIIDSIGKAVFGEATYNSLASDVKAAFQFMFNKLFGVPTVQPKIQAAAVPPLSGSIIQDGKVSIDHIPTGDVGAAILPGAGSGALLTRTTAPTAKVDAASGRNKLANGFFNNLTSSSSDITALTSSGVYSGEFQVSLDGWYLAEIGFRSDPSISFGFNVAPVLFKGADPFKIGADGHQALGTLGVRYIQSSFIVYLTAGQKVSAGYDARGDYGSFFSADTSGRETYFSLSLLNRSYA